jgi:hypothetical protein
MSRDPAAGAGDDVTAAGSGVPEVDPRLPEVDEPAQPPAASGPAWPGGRWVAAAVFVVAGIVLFAAYLAQARTVAATSESGGQALQAWDMLHGNPLLRGWTLSDVSFYTTELPEYMLVELARGLSADTVHVAAALSYTLIVLLGALLAKGTATGREGLTRLLIAAGIMLAPPLSNTFLLLSAPDHTGTHVALLAIWLILDRARPRWWAPVIIAILLTWAQVADTLVLYEGALPLAAACLMRLYRRRGPLSGQWYDLSLVIAALASVAGAKIALTQIRDAGGFIVKTPIAQFADASALSTQLWVNTGRVLNVFGADLFGLTVGHGVFGVAVHLIGVALVAWALAAAVRRLYAESDLIVQVLAIALVVVLIAYLFGTKTDENEIVGLVPIGAVLAGRLLGGRLLRAGLAPALAVVLACSAWLLYTNAVKLPAKASTPQQQVASWLEAHHLSYGLAGFWNAGSVTVDSGNRIQVRPTRMFRDRLVATLSESDAAWYDPKLHAANFVIASSWGACGGTCLSQGDLVKTFGPAVATYQVAGYQVLVWDKNILQHLRTLNWCHGWPWNTPDKASPTSCVGNSSAG